ncbi:MAG: PCRF domain-containing protein, partial [Oscillospiraceae bacterium]|nr:PCRF domain-containing protein [Oscillospiraceae bacterium]
MLQYEELRQKLNDMLPALNDLEDALGLKAMHNEIEELDMKASEPGFWDDMERSQKILQRSAHLKDKINSYEKLRSKWDDAMTLCDLADEENDLSLLPEAENTVKELEDALEQQRLQTLLTGEYDTKNAILTFHAGAGGTEAQDWAEMLYRMYTRWSERHSFKVKLLDYLDGEEAGLKSAS